MFPRVSMKTLVGDSHTTLKNPKISQVENILMRVFCLETTESNSGDPTEKKLIGTIRVGGRGRGAPRFKGKAGELGKNECSRGHLQTFPSQTCHLQTFQLYLQYSFYSVSDINSGKNNRLV